MSAAARLDYDKPGPNDIYVLRLEDADGRRVKTTLSRTELASIDDAVPVEDVLANKARALAYLLETTRKNGGS